MRRRLRQRLGRAGRILDARWIGWLGGRDGRVARKRLVANARCLLNAWLGLLRLPLADDLPGDGVIFAGGLRGTRLLLCEDLLIAEALRRRGLGGSLWSR